MKSLSSHSIEENCFKVLLKWLCPRNVGGHLNAENQVTKASEDRRGGSPFPFVMWKQISTEHKQH